MIRIHRISPMLFVFILLLNGCGSSPTNIVPTQPIAIPTALPVTPTSNSFAKTVDVGGYGLHILCTGAGSPTVVLDAGLGGYSTTWPDVIEKVKSFTRVCAYDRAGLGDSDPAPTPRTSKDMAKDLHTLLINANVPGPYVLVGFSIAGFNVRVYRSEYPTDVVGMVLVDSTHPDLFARWLAALPPPSSKDSTVFNEFRKELTTNDPTQNPEGMDFEASMAQVRTSGSLGSLPLAVLTAGESDWPEGFPSDVVTKLDQIRLALQKELVSLSSNSNHVIAEKSRHCVPCDQPDLVIETIQKVVTAARSK